MAAEHVVDQRALGGGPHSQPRGHQPRHGFATRAKLLVSRAIDFQRAVLSCADRVGGEALVPRELVQLHLPAKAPAPDWHRILRPARSGNTASISATAPIAAYERL